MSDTDDTTRCAVEQHTLLNAVLNHLVKAWVTPCSFQNFGVPDYMTSPAQNFAVLTSREVTWAILIATALCGIAPLIWSLLLYPEIFLFWVGISLTPFAVTYLGVSLIFVWVVFCNLFGKKPPIRVLYPIAILLAAGIVAVIGFHYMEFMPMALTELYVREAPHVSLIVAVSFPLIFFVVSSLVHAFVLRYVVPIGSERWEALRERAAASRLESWAENRTKSRSRDRADGLVTIGDNDIPANAIRFVEAQGNYVRVLTSDGDLTIRQPFSKVMELLPNARGIQLHRSRWAAFDAITDVTDGHDGLFVTVRGAQRIRVAKSRAECVSKALASAGVPK